MKRSIVFALAICLALQVHAQKRTRDFSLMPPTATVGTSLYRTIDVMDDREYKDNLGIIQVGIMNSKAQVIPEVPLENQIQQQLDLLVTGDKGRGTLALIIRKFAVAELTGAFSESGFFDFRADLFVKHDDQSYQRLATIDTAHVNKGMDVTNGLLMHASDIVSDFLKDNLNSIPRDTVRYTHAQIIDLENLEKQQVALYSNEALKNGLYPDYIHFRDQLPQGEVTLKDDDISKGFYAPDSNGKLKRIKANKCYAIVVNGIAYISSENNFYALYKNNNDFFFNGPSKTTASASNMVAASVMLGAIGAMLAANTTEYYVTKIDFYNGSFVKVSKL
jgi:hypothetical protein